MRFRKLESGSISEATVNIFTDRTVFIQLRFKNIWMLVYDKQLEDPVIQIKWYQEGSLFWDNPIFS